MIYISNNSQQNTAITMIIVGRRYDWEMFKFLSNDSRGQYLLCMREIRGLIFSNLFVFLYTLDFDHSLHPAITVIVFLNLHTLRSQSPAKAVVPRKIRMKTSGTKVKIS